MPQPEDRVQELKRARLRAVAIAFALFGAILGGFLVFTYQPPVDEPQQSLPAVELDPQREDLHVGVLAPLQGPLKAYGESIVRGATVAANMINAGKGILNRNVKLHVADTRSLPNLTAELAEELIRREKVSLLIGTVDDEAALATAKVANAQKTPFVYLGNGGIKTCMSSDALKVSDYVWGVGLTEYMVTEPFLIYLADRLRRPETKFRIYYFGTDDAESRAESSFTIRTAESLGFETVAEEYVDIRIRDYFQRIRQIFNLAPDLLYVTTSRVGSPAFMEQAAKLGVKAEMVVAGSRPFEQEMVQPLGKALDGVYTVARYSTEIDSEENRAFLAEWRKYYPAPEEVPTGIAVGGAYTALRLAEAAFNRAGSLDPAAFREAMKELEISVPQGRVVMESENNALLQPLYAVHVEDGKYRIAEYLGDVSHPALEDCLAVATEGAPEAPLPASYDD
ncbi:MAG: ABC transporter substrate-binding protein [Bdellovibrionales bacterium]|nr:ABC transporter substrate-binding protein [Bdellovibrionales bacterium]